MAASCLKDELHQRSGSVRAAAALRSKRTCWHDLATDRFRWAQGWDVGWDRPGRPVREGRLGRLTQNNDRLSKAKKQSHFNWMTEAELSEAEVIVAQAFTGTD